MKKPTTLALLTLLLAALTLAGTAFAATEPADNAETGPQPVALVASLVPQSALAQILGAATVQAANLTGCTAEQSCPNGTQVTCEGNSTCLVGAYDVTCDGQNTACSCVQPANPDPYCICDCFVEFPTAGSGRLQCIKCCGGRGC